MEVSNRTALGLAAGCVLALGALVWLVRRAPAQPPPRGDMAPLEAVEATASLAVNGFGTAVISLPVGATRAAPVVVAVLGIGDTPEEQCAAWRDIIGPRAFIVCPRGAPHMVTEDAGTDEPSEQAEPVNPIAKEPVPTDPVAIEVAPVPGEETEGEGEGDGGAEPRQPRRAVVTPRAAPSAARRAEPPRTHQVGFYPVDLASLDREVSAALGALKARYGAYVADGGAVYAGFSRGAFLGAQLAARRPDHFKRLVLIEGGQSPWQREAAAAFARGGGKRVLFVCGQPQCVDESEPAAATLRAERIDTRVIHGEGEGHGYKKQVKAELRRSFSWVIDGEREWHD